MSRRELFGRKGLWTGTDWLIAVLLFMITFLSRIPFRTHLFYAWDSVLYARAIEDFNVTLHQPQPPGHIYYVGLVWLSDTLIGDANAAMVWISVFASAGAVVALFWLGREMFGRTAGLLAAVFLATSLSFWAHGELAYPYTLLALLAILTAAFVFQTWEGRAGYVLPAALVLGIASGFRQDLLFFMLPLWLGGLQGKSLRLKAGAAAMLVGASAAWYVPSALLSGGFGAYQEASSAQSDFLVRTASVFGGGLVALADNLSHIGRFTLYALSAAVFLVLYFLVKLVLGQSSVAMRDKRLLFIVVWMAPSILFYVFMHIGEYGYVFTFLPALLLLAADGGCELASDLSRFITGGRRKGVFILGLTSLVLAANLTLFLVLTPHLSANRIAANEELQQSRIDAIRKNFDPDSTLLVSTYNYQQARYYLGDYSHWYVDPVTSKRRTLEIPPGIDHAVLFDESIEPAGGAEKSSLPLPHGQELYYFNVGGKCLLTVDWTMHTANLAELRRGST